MSGAQATTPPLAADKSPRGSPARDAAARERGKGAGVGSHQRGGALDDHGEASSAALGGGADDGFSGGLTLEHVPGATSDDRHAVLARPLHRLGVEHFGAALGHFLHRLVVELGQVLRVRDHARIGAVDAVDVAVDLAAFGPERGREGHCGGVRAAAAQGGDLAAVAHALVAGDDHDASAVELVLDAVRAHLDDARVEVAVVRDDSGLRAGEADGVVPARLDGDGEQRHADALAGADQHVELALGGLRASVRRAAGTHGGLLGEGQQVVGGLAHGTDHDDDVVAVLLRTDDLIGYGAELVDVGDGRSAVLLNDDGHGGRVPWCRIAGQVVREPYRDS